MLINKLKIFGSSTTINGVKIPTDFDIGSIINNIVISKDGKEYIFIQDNKDYVRSNIPENGEIIIGGTKINYDMNTKTVRMTHNGTGMNIHGSKIVARGNSISIKTDGDIVGGSTISIGNAYSQKIDKTYESEGIQNVKLRDSGNDMNLRLSTDNKIYVKGETNNEPQYADNQLSIDGLEGILSIPKSNNNIEIDLKTSGGNITGDVAHKGYIKTSGGNIILDVYAPVAIIAKTSGGDIDIFGMMRKDKREYVPPNDMPIGTLELKTSGGNIEVNYKYKPFNPMK